ncbi:hypothetical protein ACR9E3_15875 [Actinomycetospora sp. C-140]
MNDDRTPDVEVRAAVRARRVRFHAEPRVHIDATRHGSRRTNLPDEVAAHVTYEDIRVDAAILSWLEATDDPSENADRPGGR